MTLNEMKNVAARALKGRRIQKGKSRAHCPFCVDKIGKADDRLSLVYFDDTKRVACYRCKTWLFLTGGSTYSSETPRKEKEAGPVAIPKGCFPIGDPAVASSLAGGPGFRYITETRRIPLDVAQQAQIYIGAFGELAGSVVIPILADDDKTWLGYVSRAWNFKAYRNATAMTRGRFFNHVALSVKTNVPLVVAEGCFDALPTWPNGVASLGKPTEEHIEQLAKCGRPIVMALDADAQDECWGVALQIYMRRFEPPLSPKSLAVMTGYEPPNRIAVACLGFPPTKDPGDFTGVETMSAAYRALARAHDQPPEHPRDLWPSHKRFDCVLPCSDVQRQQLEKAI